MKHFASLCILLVLIHFSTQVSKYVNCPENMTDSCACCEVTCLSSSERIAKACALSLCAPGTQIGYHEADMTKEYPDCCGHPICNE